MNKAQLNPYLGFNNNCREALEFYHGVMGGDLKIMTFGDQYADASAEDKDKVMHGVLKNDWFALMASDSAPGSTTTFGDNISLSLSGEDDALLSKLFEGLSAGGKVTIPLEKQVWGDKFGMFTDKFDMHWMVNVTSPENAGK